MDFYKKLLTNLALSYAATFKLNTRQIDIRISFLNVPLSESSEYVAPPTRIFSWWTVKIEQACSTYWNEKSLKAKIANFKEFSIALDEITDISDTAQLAIFIRGIDENFNITEELLSLHPMKGITTGEEIFNSVDLIFKKSIGIYWQGYAPTVRQQWSEPRKGSMGMLTKKNWSKKADQLTLYYPSTKFMCEIGQVNKFRNIVNSEIIWLNYFPIMTMLHINVKSDGCQKRKCLSVFTI